MQIRPLVSLVWLAAFIMALGRRARGLGPALSHARAGAAPPRRRPQSPASRRDEPLPAAARGVRAAGGRARDRHPALPGEGHHCLAADRQAGAAVRAAGARPILARRCARRSSRGAGTCSTCGAPGAAECRAEHDDAAEGAARPGVVPLIGLDWKDDDAQARAWLAQLGNPYQAVAVDASGARRSTGACTVPRRHSWSIRRASSSTSTSAR